VRSRNGFEKAVAIVQRRPWTVGYLLVVTTVTLILQVLEVSG
jgi:hypothetical protein